MRLSRLFVAMMFVLAGCAVLGATQLLRPAPAFAVSCGSEAYSQVGYTGFTAPPGTWARTPEGVSAYLTVRNAHVCGDNSYSTFDSFSTTWIMLQDRGVSNHYAQAGYMWDIQSGCMRDYTEWNIGESNWVAPQGVHRSLGQCRVAGSRITAAVEYKGAAGPHPSSSGYVELESGSLQIQAPFDPWRQGWSFMPFFAGEVNRAYASDVPGSTAGHADIYSMGIQSVATGKLVTIPCYLVQVQNYTKPNPNRFFSVASACDHIAVYTNPVIRG